MDTTDMIDLGREYDSGPCCPPSDKKEKGKKSYPSLYISDLEDIPDLPEGDFYILAKVKVCSTTKSMRDDEAKVSMELEVKSMKPMGEAESEEDSEEIEVVDTADALEKAVMGKDTDYED
jgi:hypothetical protein